MVGIWLYKIKIYNYNINNQDPLCHNWSPKYIIITVDLWDISQLNNFTSNGDCPAHGKTQQETQLCVIDNVVFKW